MMENFFMNDVGSALNCAVRRNQSYQFMIDMGAMNRKGMNLRHSKPYITDAFLLSHYHYDHYNGIGKQKLQFDLKDVYLPKMPKILISCGSSNLSTRFLTSLMSFAIYKIGMYLVDYILCLLRSRGGLNFKVHYVSKEDNIVYGKRRYEVLWPPCQLEEKETINSVTKAVESYETLKEKYPILKHTEAIGYEMQNMFDLFSKYEHQQQLVNDGILEEAFYRIMGSFRMLEGERYDSPEEKLAFESDELFKEANDSLRKAANHLSIAFRQEDNILFLGDLEERELGIVCAELIEKEQTRYNILIAPHHGTHWHETMKHLKCDYALASVGNDLAKTIKISELSSISRCLLRTDCYGEINIQSKQILS